MHFETRQSEAAHFTAPFTALECEAVATSQTSQLLGADDYEAIKVVEHLMVKRNLGGAAAEFLPCYKTDSDGSTAFVSIQVHTCPGRVGESDTVGCLM